VGREGHGEDQGQTGRVPEQPIQKEIDQTFSVLYDSVVINIEARAIQRYSCNQLMMPLNPIFCFS
jgi:hypothetical protein